MGRFYKAGVPCHLCGLPIADWIIYQHHPLSGTVDHIIPRSLGGLDRGSNRAPAHACCNWHRGVREITPQVREECLQVAVRNFAEHLQHLPERSSRWARTKRLARRYLKKALDTDAAPLYSSIVRGGSG